MGSIEEIVGHRQVFTQELGTLSGEIEVTVEDGIGKVRYQDTAVWHTLGNEAGSEPKKWGTVEELVRAISNYEPIRDAVGNAIPFEA